MAEYKSRTTSKPEQSLLEALWAFYPRVVGGALVEEVRLAGKHLVFVDALLSEEKVIVEYDGEYWHRKRSRQDGRKSRALLRGGYRVIRVRERRGERVLPFLKMEDEGIYQISFDVAEGDYASLVEEIRRFIHGGD